MGTIVPSACKNPLGITDAYADDVMFEFLPGGTVRLTFITIENEQPVVVAKVVRSLSTCASHGRIMTERNRLLM